jgi:hypothetical protein
MNPELVFPFLLTSLNLLHQAEQLVGGPRPTRARRQVLTEFLGKVWGGAPGEVARADAQLAQLEDGIRWWVPAVNAYSRLGGF